LALRPLLISNFPGGALLEAGLDTTATFLEYFIQLITVHPHVQKRAQEEIDTWIGPTRSPILDDIHSLPYIQAIIKEVHRFRPVAPMGVPHATTGDLTIDGYMIPKGSTIIANAWAAYRSEDLYEQPHIFNPDRFMTSDTGTKRGADLAGYRDDLVFGAGRRMCPGIFLAQNSINLIVTNLLWAFNFDFAKHATTGKLIPIDINKFQEALVVCAEPFECSITSRGRVQAEIIRSQFEKARSTFVQFEHGLDSEPDSHIGHRW